MQKLRKVIEAFKRAAEEEESNRQKMCRSSSAESSQWDGRMVLGCRLLTEGAGLLLRLILRASSCRLLMTLLAVEDTKATGSDATWRTGTLLLREGTGGGGKVGMASEGAAGLGCKVVG